MASSSSSSAHSAPPSLSQSWNHDVFLSFRGKDTRKTFVDHLYTALVQQGIHTYKDDETLPRGESITPSLLKAIQESRIAIVVFSKNYADSAWCLDELVCIIKCMEEREQIVMPIFYDLNPSEVRKQKRKYGEAFTKYESENNNKVEGWRKALLAASNLSGWVPKDIENGHESKCIKQIVDIISQRLHPLTSSSDEDDVIGMRDRVQELISKLEIGLGGKRMVGIWGVGGSGKTTLASSIYDEIYSEFDGSCFIKNVREESIKKGLENLQKQILCGVLKQKQVEIGSVEEGRRMIRSKLHHRNVLIVLDDVDNLEQLEELVGSRNWFGNGSRILITTRDEHVLTGHKVDVINNISLLNNDEAMKLFCKHAPRGDKRKEDYEVLSKQVVSYAGGLPLALRVLGRFLSDKDMNEWRCALARLKEIPDNKILDKLKISFDGLRPLERELFLDIACFFRGRYKDEECMSILDVCGFHPGIGIKVLVQKALINIKENGMFDMHDLVQEMAHYIVRGGHPHNPEKHSRVWKSEDILKISAMDVTTNLDRIEAIDVRLSWWSSYRSDEAQRVLEVAANMKKLRCICLDFGFAETTLPQMFPPGEICCLTLCSLKVKQIWEGNKFLPNLRMIKLENLRKLIKTPDFEGLPNLERFMVDHALLLEEIHPSFGLLEKLVYVEIVCCDNLKMVPPITRSMKLEDFVLSSCRKIFKSSKIQENILPPNMNHIGLWFISKCLRKLDLKSCNLADGDIRSAADWELPNLQELDLTKNKFSRLNFSLLRLPRLKWLDVSHCFDLVELSELPSSIAVVIADGCNSLETLGDISNCKWLCKVSLLGDYKIDRLGHDILVESMLQGSAKDHFFSINLSHSEIWRKYVPCLYLVKTFTMLLPPNWYDYYCGILMFVNSGEIYGRILHPPDVHVNILFKQGVEEDFQSALGQESNETEISFYGMVCVGYVSFRSLTNTVSLNSTYNMLSFSIHRKNEEVERKFRAVLVPRKSRDDLIQTTDCSEFWDDGKTFRVQHDSYSSIKILWTPPKREPFNWFYDHY